MTDQIAELRRLLAEATHGEWTYDDEDGAIEQDGGSLGFIHDHGNVHTVLRHGEPRKNADGRLIVAAVNALPAILDQLDAERGKCERLRAMVDEARTLLNEVAYSPEEDGTDWVQAVLWIQRAGQALSPPEPKP